MSFKEPHPKLPRATLEQKIRILDYYHSSERPQLDTVDKFKEEVAISTSTFNEWVKHEGEYRERYQLLLTDFQKNARRKVKYKYDKINRAMDLLVQQKMERNESVTEPVLRGYWQIYAHQFGVDNPKRLCGFSHGWLSQFKKRHGLSRKRDLRDADLTRTNNEKLLASAVGSLASGLTAQSAGSTPQEEQQVQVTQTSPHKVDASNGSQFQPQHTLSFPGQFPYYDEDKDRTEESESRESLASAMSLSIAPDKPATAADIERFIFTIADHFFHEHQYEYPQTVKMYLEFKNSFLGERLIDLRLKPEVGVPISQPLQSHTMPSHQSLGTVSRETHHQSIANHHQGSHHLQAAPVQNHKSHHNLHQSHQSQLQAQPQSSRVGQSHGHSSTHQISHSSQTSSRASHQSRSSSHNHGQSHQGQSQGHQLNGPPEGKRRHIDTTIPPLPASQLLSLHQLHPLPKKHAPVTQLQPQMHQSLQRLPSNRQEHLLPTLPALIPAQATYQNPRHLQTPETREPVLEDMFIRRDGRPYREDGEWSKSALRKIWEQNKIMLS